jgi:C4-type Zn-finger protein
MQNLEGIVNTINDSLNKISTKKEQSQKRRDGVAQQLQALQDRKRNYHKAVAEFQEVCW